MEVTMDAIELNRKYWSDAEVDLQARPKNFELCCLIVASYLAIWLLRQPKCQEDLHRHRLKDRGPTSTKEMLSRPSKHGAKHKQAVQLKCQAVALC